VAVKFTSFEDDWLKGIYMYFNRTYMDVNHKYFRLAVWADDNGKPGELLLNQVGARPEFTDELNKFAYYAFDEPIWIEAGTFYVGWIQVTAEMLNIGFDLNRYSPGKLFYNVGSGWENSRFKGSLMVRPVFGYLTNPPMGSPLIKTEINFTVYPNPAQEYFSINTLGVECSLCTVLVHSITGQLVASAAFASEPISISHLVAGTYIVSLRTPNGIIGKQKLMIVKW
jgi:hypothetical protein